MKERVKRPVLGEGPAVGFLEQDDAGHIYRIMRDTPRHKELKEKAKAFLLSKGYDDIVEEIYAGVEYGTFTYSSPAVVDVAALKDEKIVAIVECGQTPEGKLRTLARHFDEVYHLPYSSEIKKVERVPVEYRWELP